MDRDNFQDLQNAERYLQNRTSEAAHLVRYLEDLDSGVQQKCNIFQMQKQIPPYRLGFTAITDIHSRSREKKRVYKFQTMAAGAQTLTVNQPRLAWWGGPRRVGGGLSHNRENDPECYKSTKFPPVTQHVSASFVSCNSFFLLLLKRHFFPQQPPPLW